jgi:hypothetical protein
MAAAHPGAGTAGSANVSVQYEGPVMMGGRSITHPLAYRYDRQGTAYMFQTFPEVTSISPSNGSLAGGTLVTITGRGFPSLDWGLGDTLSVQLYGVPCAVLSSTYSVVVCRSGAAPSSLPIAYAAPIKGLYPGMRGAEYEFYNTSSVSYANLTAALNSSITIASSPGSYKAPLMDVAEGKEFSSPNSCSRIKFFFTAPEAGTYQFLANCDDYCKLDGTWLLPVRVMLAANNDACRQLPVDSLQPL